MLTLNISQADILLANYERINNPICTTRKRMDALYWISQGISRQEAASRSGVHRNSVRNYIRQYNKDGLACLKTYKYKGAVSILAGERVSIEKMFREHLPRCSQEARAMIQELTGQELSCEEVRRFMHKIGMKPRMTGHVPAKADSEQQQVFVDQSLNPLLEKAKAGQCHLFFMDAAHFVLAAFVGMVWCFERVFIKASPGRHRINVLGALNAITHQMETIVNTDYINAGTIAQMLKLLADKFKGLPIYIVLDNARYQHCNFIKELAVSLNIELIFLPPYSPNLNLIERMWKYIKKEVLALQYFNCKELFHQKIRQALHDINHDPQVKKKIKSLITPNFQSFAQNLMW